MSAAIDAVVFDVDGVLVDTEASYTEAVVRTVAFLVPGAPVDRAVVRLWRRSGDWNNDWDLAYGLYCWLVGSPELLSDEAARKTLAELEAAAGDRATLDYATVQGVFEEHYNGTAVAVERYAVVPRVHNERPLALDETIRLVPELVAELRGIGIDKFGVVTGRVRADWAQVAERIPLPKDVVVATDEDGRKPDPAALELVVAALAPRRFVTVGDTLNDVRMMRAYNAVNGVKGEVVVLCRAEDDAAYREAGAAATIRSLGELPGVIARLSA